MKIIIASRESRLALWQAEHVKARIEALAPQGVHAPGAHAGHQVSILGMTTRGDQILDRALSKVGGKGLFIKELEVALQEGRADLAVHSAKDVPMQIEPGFELIGFMQREDPRDAFISPHFASLADLPAGAVVGTSSLRRQALLLRAYPHLKVEPLRGNLDTRFAKLDRGDYAAIILAAAGVKRLGLASRIRSVLPQAEFLPAAGQGALALEIPAGRDDLKAVLAPLLCAQTTACVQAEREVARLLGGSCQVPMAAYAEFDAAGALTLTARVCDPAGLQLLEAHGVAAGHETPVELGARVAAELRAAGADAILAACQADAT